MTAAQLVGQCRRHGFAVVYDPAGGPRLARQRAGAVMPDRLIESLKARRGEVIAWFERGGAWVPAGCDGRRCGHCEPLAIVPPGFEAFVEFLGCHWKAGS